MKVVILTPTDPEPVRAALAGVDGTRPVVVNSIDELKGELPGAEGLVIGSYLYKDAYPSIRAECDALRWVQLSASGYEIVGEIGAPDGVQVMRATGVWGRSVAGHALALAFGLMRRLPECENARAQAQWIRSDIAPKMMSLAGRKVLLVGYGDIGGVLAPTLKLLGARVTIVARSARSDSADGPVHAVEALDDLLPEAEIVFLTVPSSASTTGLFDRARLRRMRKGALLINVGRGEVIDENALADLLIAGKLGGAGLDVFVKEPLPSASPLWQCPNVILTPHTAAFGDRESIERLGALAAENLHLIRAGREPVGLVAVGNSMRTG